MISTEPTMRVPCSRCGQLNDAERAAEVNFRCTACDSNNTVRILAISSGAPALAREAIPQPRRRTASHTSHPAASPVQKASGERTGAMGRAKQVLVGLVVLAIAGVAALMGKSQVSKGVPPVPEQTVQSVKADVEEIKERAHR